MNTEKAIDTGENAQPIALLRPPKMNISEIRQIIMMCPASILANKRMISANGLVNTPRNSTSTNIGLMAPGTGGLKI